MGPISPFWLPRLDLLLELEIDALCVGEFPYKSPLHAMHFNYAPHDQQLKQTSQPGLQLSLKGLFPAQAYTKQTMLRLPYCKPLAAMTFGHHQKRLDLVCDTLVIEADTHHFYLI